MDYLFFASNSVCFAVTVLLLFWRMSKYHSGLLIRHWVIALLAGIVFHLLNQYIFSRIVFLYFIINAAVPIMLLLVLFWLFWTHEGVE
ncbi:MAG: hypothetical protein GX028_01635 [Clostridiaceae bacterium]|nr:hypothetical protein [Clostridiaceae bacterium]